MKHLNHLTDEDIMNAAKNDRIEMLAVLFERHHVRLYNFLLRLTGNTSVSEDLVQEIFFVIFIQSTRPDLSRRVYPLPEE